MISILILSEEIDVSCDLVCSWLNKNHNSYTRLNTENLLNPEIEVDIRSTSKSIIMTTNNNTLNLNEINTVWFRRGYLRFFSINKLSNSQEEIVNGLNKHIANEGDTLKDYIYDFLCLKRNINHANVYNYNKLTALSTALSIGLNVPDTLVTNNAKIIREFIYKKHNAITKCVQDIQSFKMGEVFTTVGRIAMVTPQDITETTYWYSLFQQEITKRYELRIFYWLGKCYAMAIFSQMDSKSRLDFRDVDVNGSHPNRMVPFTLPKNIRLKIDRLMKKLKLESGSIDMIVSPDNEYFFLEVNPVGQFNFISELCNYYIEKDIAISLAQ